MTVTFIDADSGKDLQKVNLRVIPNIGETVILFGNIDIYEVMQVTHSICLE